MQGYRILYAKNQDDEENLLKGAVKMEVGKKVQSLNITGLETWTEYKIWVLGFTGVGDSPMSQPIIVKTDESGRYWELIYLNLSHWFPAPTQFF